MLNYAWKWIITWASGRENYMRIGAFHNAQVVSSIPSVVIGCEPRSGHASVYICWPTHWHFCLSADASQATKSVSTVYYFLLSARAVAFSQTMKQRSLLNLFNGYLYLIESNTSSQLLILSIKMEPLNSRGELYFRWKDVSLLSQSCPKTCEFTHWWLQCILEIAVIIKTQEKPHMKVLLVQNQT